MGGESPLRLLFVDDEASIRLTLPPVLQKVGFDVRVAESVSDALFEINSRQFDVLISDLNIGEEGDGFLVTSAMRHVQPQCLTFILTGYPAFETALQAIHNRVDDYLVKPVEIDSLTKTLREKLANRGVKLAFGQKRLADIMRNNRVQIVGAALTSENGTASGSENQLSAFLDALIKQLEVGREEPNSDVLRLAPEYGKKHADVHHPPAALASQFRSLEQEVYRCVQNSMSGMDLPVLISDLKRFTSGLHSLLETSLRAYSSPAKTTRQPKAAKPARPKRRPRK